MEKKRDAWGGGRKTQKKKAKTGRFCPITFQVLLPSIVPVTRDVTSRGNKNSHAHTHSLSRRDAYLIT